MEMLVILLALLIPAIYMIAPDERNSTELPGNRMPARSRQELFLMGFSTDLNNSNIKCVKSTFSSKTNETVVRYVQLKWQIDQHWINVNRSITIHVPNDPIVFNLTLDYDDFFMLYAGAKTQYRIKYYNTRCLILGDESPSMWEKPPCSLWVKINGTRNVPKLCKLHFENNCRNTSIFDQSYWPTCNKTF
uniref:Putative group viii salivary lipocalin n=1 Tax=Rhipicephalus pulchellus TaxID=72859 RepID=L7MBW6_RHIPC